MRNWTCVDESNPKLCDYYDVTIEDCHSDTRIMNVALYRPKYNVWDLMIDRDNYEGFRVIAWRDRGKAFEWKDLKEGRNG